MTASNFDHAFDLVLKYEGGYVNNSHDPGGPTNLGITLATLRAWRQRHVDINDVKTLTKAEAGQIYRANYWDKIHGDDLPSGVDFAVFDFAVNSGPGTAARLLQRALAVSTDGAIGPLTLKAAQQVRAADLITSYLDKRLAYLEGLGTWATFGKGWAARVASVKREALKMAVTPAMPPTLPPKQPDDPGPVTPPQPAPVAGFFTRLWRYLFGA